MRTIHHLYLSPPGMDSWGEDLLGNGRVDAIAAGTSAVIADQSEGTYDAKFSLEDGQVCIVRNVEFSADNAWSIDPDMMQDCQLP